MDPQLLNALVQFVSLVALGTLPVLATYLAKWLKVKIAIAHADLNNKYPDLMYHMDWFAGIAVNAAEAAGLKDLALNKKKFAIDLAEKFLEAKGISVDLDILDAAIEAAWIEAYGQEKLEAAKKAKAKAE